MKKAALPNLNEIYSYFDDGKINMMRYGEVKIIKYTDLTTLEIKNKDLYNTIKDECESCYWLFLPFNKQHDVVVGIDVFPDIGKYNEKHYFIRTKDGGWYGAAGDCDNAELDFYDNKKTDLFNIMLENNFDNDINEFNKWKKEINDNKEKSIKELDDTVKKADKDRKRREKNKDLLKNNSMFSPKLKDWTNQTKRIYLLEQPKSYLQEIFKNISNKKLSREDNKMTKEKFVDKYFDTLWEAMTYEIEEIGEY